MGEISDLIFESPYNNKVGNSPFIIFSLTSNTFVS